jgi:hypothetical protein
MILATQYLSVLDPQIRDAVLGNVGTLITFRVGAADAGALARELGDPVTVEDLTGLRHYDVFLRLLITGQPSRAFSASIPARVPNSRGL